MICIQEDGKIFTWGIGEQGQLGRKVMSRHALEASLVPRPINFRPYRRTAKFKSVFTGGYHSVLLHESNELFSFGLNNYGQLGLGDLLDHDIPDLVEGLEKEEIESVGGGEHFTVILQKDGSF
jgi:regulator of chromosome condensation